MSNKGHALARDELVRVLTAYTGVTTEDGNIGGTTLVDANLKDNPSISAQAIPEKTILIMSGDAIMEDKGAASFDNATGTITLQGTGFSAQIMAGTTFRILNISSVEIDVADIDTKIGTNTDPAGTTTLFAWLAKIFDAADVAAIEVKLDDGTTGLAALKALIDAVEGKLDLSAPAATFVYLDAGGEQAVFTYTPTLSAIVHTVWLDLSTLTQNTTIRVKIGGITTETFNWTTGMDDGVYFRQIALPATKALQVTLQEVVDEGADRNIPYYYAYEER